MGDEPAPSDPGAELRRRAEESLRSSSAPGRETPAGPEQRLIHELQVHQIELELQNDELRRAQEELAHSRDRYFELYEVAPVGYLTLGASGLIEELNLAAAAAIGMERGLLIGRPFGLFVVPEDHPEYYRRLVLVRDSADRQIFDLRMRRANGVIFHASVQGAQTRDVKGTKALRFVFTDITDRKAAEELRMDLERRSSQSRRLQSLGAMAGGIAHVFNNQLTVVIGNLDQALHVLGRGQAGTPQLSMIQSALQAATRMAELTRRIVAGTGHAWRTNVAVDIGALARDEVRLLGAAFPEHVTLDLRVAENLPQATGDPDQIRLIVRELVTNAGEALEGRPGTVMLTAGFEHVGQALLERSCLEEKAAAGSFIVLAITDTGRGMSEETQRHLFEPFFSTREPGRGLGLSAVLGIVRSHRGALLLETQEGRGTRVQVLLPCAAGVAGAPPSATASATTTPFGAGTPPRST